MYFYTCSAIPAVGGHILNVPIISKIVAHSSNAKNVVAGLSVAQWSEQAVGILHRRPLTVCHSTSLCPHLLSLLHSCPGIKFMKTKKCG